MKGEEEKEEEEKEGEEEEEQIYYRGIEGKCNNRQKIRRRRSELQDDAEVEE